MPHAESSCETNREVLLLVWRNTRAVLFLFWGWGGCEGQLVWVGFQTARENRTTKLTASSEQSHTAGRRQS